MKREMVTGVFVLLLSVFGIAAAEDVRGYWMNSDGESGLPLSVSYLYEYEGKLYGRTVVIYDDEGNILETAGSPSLRAEMLKGEPFYSGLDFIWGLRPRGKKWVKGKIMDPESAKIYDCDIWLGGDELIVKGYIGIFGSKQRWRRVNPEDLPEGAGVLNEGALVPQVPESK